MYLVQHGEHPSGAASVTPNPLLAVCIPTYRRPDQLRRCLESVIRSAAPHAVAIVVADDAADDTNVALLEELRRRYPLLVHYRNASNLGIDGNILRCVDLCQARHAWILGEDDRMLPEGVSTVLAALAAHEPPFLYVNYASVDEAVAMVLCERSVDLDVDVTVDAAEFLRNHAWSAGFIGACVVDRRLWERVDPAPYLGTYFAHVGVILESVAGRQVRMLARPLVLNRVGSARAFTWAGSTFDVLHGWERMVDALRSHYPGPACDASATGFRRAHGMGSLRFLAYLRADAALDPTQHERWVRRGPYPRSSQLASWWIARIPPAVFRAARKVVTAARRARLRRIVDD
jgi:hypothetical protein